MSAAAILCGKRSNYFFDDFQCSPSSSSPPVPKRIRCFSSSFSPGRSNFDSDHSFSAVNIFSGSSISSLSALDHLLMIFPDMDKQLVERALEECGDDLDSAIKSLNELRLGSGENPRSVAGSSSATQDSSSQFFTQGTATTNGETTPAEDLSSAKVVHMDSTEWVELFVREMMSASNIDDAKARASRALEVLEKSICACATEATACNFQQENIMLKQQLEALIQENAILKRAVAIQHERQKEFEDRGHELNQLKQSVAQYQEQLRTLEVNNYALSMHLKQAQQSNSIPGRFNPDVF
ncbi:PREDICTED: uncharacterized protein LOC109234189 isoform X2 [Nicotiana attenuata]|uniref:CUE domain-containing protein n=2 Tax=Nicotiana attenuata TaxID=49451 RepID=A0A1J6HVD7_NICAT|nr:PREDICTED: uncharacterized protein LOC109234189 isoform X2 [Nicotiana attenuata]OIS96789.1 hypothetical protein A4A49_01380 [Nicotiana attenuata]